MTDVIWALRTRDRVIACPSKPTANAVVLYLAADGHVPTSKVEQWADAGVMVACVRWPGADAELTDDDRLDLEDSVDGLVELASVVGVVIEEGAVDVVRPIFDGRALAYVGVAELSNVLPILQQIAPVEG